VAFNRGSKRLFLRFKKAPGNMFPRNNLARETATLVNDLIKV